MTISSATSEGSRPARALLWTPASETPVPEAPSAPKKSTPRSRRPAKPVGKIDPAPPGPPNARPRYSPTIKELPADERPRERLFAYGPQALTTAELIAILIRVGTHERSAVSLGEHLLAHCGNIKGIASASVEQLSHVKGIGPAKAAEIKAALELGSRLSLFTEEVRPAIGGPRDVSNLLMPDLRYIKKETLKSLLLDTKNRVISIKTACRVSAKVRGEECVFEVIELGELTQAA